MNPLSQWAHLRTNLLSALTALLTIVALCLLGVILPGQVCARSQTLAEQRALAVGATLAAALAPALDLDDQPRALQLLSGLRQTPDAVYGFLKRADGSVVASWPPGLGKSEADQETRQEPLVFTERGLLRVLAAVQGGGDRRGLLGVGFSTARQQRQRRKNRLLVAAAAALFFALGLCIALLSRDVLLRGQRAAEALAKTESAFRALIEGSPDPMAVTRQGRWAMVNRALVSYLGYSSADELMQTHPLDVVSEGDRPTAAANVAKMIEAEMPIGPHEVRLLRKGGGVVTAEVIGLPLLVEGQPSQVGMARDLTAQRQLTARMMQIDRLLAVGTLAAGVAHEINNPLSFVMGNVEWVGAKLAALEQRLRDGSPDLKSALADLARFREVIGETRSGAERVRVIVRDLKTLSRSEDEQRGPVSVERVVESALQMSWNEIRHRARLTKEFTEVPDVLANEARLCQVFLNLLINAAQAIPEGHSEENQITVRIRPGEGRVAVEVQDTGSGMTKDVLSRLFDPFFTTKPVGHGTGLGLSICQSIVQGLGGDIQVESEPGQGSVFRVHLPPADRAQTPDRPTPVPIAPGRRGRVLVVDDEPLVGASLSRTLSEDHEVVVATSAREALGRLDVGERYDVILCDVMMPDITGYELYEKLSHKAPDQARRMIFLTGGAFTPRAREFLGEVENRRVDKPFDLERVRRLVRMMVT